MTRLLHPTRIELSSGPQMEVTVDGQVMAITPEIAPGGPYATPGPPALLVHRLTEEGRFTTLWIVDAFTAWAIPKSAEYLTTVVVPILSPEGRIVDSMGAHVFVRPTAGST